jgi:4a-hydroxytetrahydrobiopterin dehydratase
VSNLLTESDVTTRLAELPDWTRADADGPSITATYELADFAAALAFVNAVGAEAEERDHHPDIDIRWNTVTLVLSTHSEGGLTAADFDLATTISGLPR